MEENHFSFTMVVQQRDDVSTLGEYGFSKKQLPANIGGDLVHNHFSWLKERKTIEKSM